jgi:hypothetical protein
VPRIGRLMAPGAIKRVFAPYTVPARFEGNIRSPLALRPSQIKAVADEARMMLESTRRLSRHYQDLRVPVRIIAGSEDRIVETDKSRVCTGSSARARFSRCREAAISFITPQSWQRFPT